MVKWDEAKPVVSTFNFGDDWLDDLEEALDFDSPEEVQEAEKAQGVSAVSQKDVAVAVEPSDELSVDLDFDVEEASTRDVSMKTGRVRTQSLNIEELQKRAAMREAQSVPVNTDPLKDEQLWQFVSLIFTRLFDDLDLILVQKKCSEVCDLMKQLNRLMNFIGFSGLDEQLPILAYIGNILPVSFSDAPIGVETERRFDALKMRNFVDKSGEFLNCLTYLLDYISKKTEFFNAKRFASNLSSLYAQVGVTPNQPSSEAPLAVTDGINPLELTSRTINKLSRTLEALVTESLHYVESAVFYGYASGFADAAKSLNNAVQVAREYRFKDFEAEFTELYHTVHALRLPNRPDASFYGVYDRVCSLLESHFSKTLSEKKIRHLRSLIAKFHTMDEASVLPFGNRWKEFIKAVAPLLDLEHTNKAILRERLVQMQELAIKNEISWLVTTFDNLGQHWKFYPESSSEALILLIGELRAFPTEEIEEADLEQLDNESLRILFKRSPDARVQTPYAMVMNALSYSENLCCALEDPASLSSESVQELLIDAREINCHAIVRICELLLCLFERIPHKKGDQAVVVADSVIAALCFTSGLMQTVCERLRDHLEHDPMSAALTSKQFFYRVLLSRYQTPCQPRDGVTWFIIKRLNGILSELQLVWVNTSTPTSTEYYCALIRRLLHIATICELRDVRQMLITHLDDIGTQDFINTENSTMSRQCARIIRAIEERCPKLTNQPCSNQVLLFFSKTIAAINQLLSSGDAASADALRSELTRIETRMSMLGMTTDFPPVIVFIHELHSLAYQDELSKSDVEDFLYQMLNVANNVCPEWVQPREAELEFVKTSVSIPMTFFQEMLDSLSVIHESLQLRAKDEPVAWGKVSTLYKDVRSLVNYLPFALQIVVQNAQNRSRYLKKNIIFEINTEGYPPEAEMTTENMRPVLSIVFTTVVECLIQLLVDNAFSLTDNSSRITIVLHPFANEYSASILHNGKMFTYDEILERLSRVNIMPAPDENVFDLLVSSKRLAMTYPPINTLAYMLPIVRQFGGMLDISADREARTRIHLSFKF